MNFWNQQLIYQIYRDGLMAVEKIIKQKAGKNLVE